MMKRLFDIVASVTALIVVSPFLFLAAIGIRLQSPGPVFYRAKRMGRNMQEFEMLKFRSMTVGANRGSAITGRSDNRVFPFGGLLRKLKIDELPQFINVLKGDMSIVGPRPEDPRIVRDFYTEWMKETVSVQPGITSPGALYYYAVETNLPGDGDVEHTYVTVFLPPKLALERAYLERSNFISDLYYVCLTFLAVVSAVFGQRVFPLQTDMDAAEKWARIPKEP